jgi:hypothetical protein
MSITVKINTVDQTVNIQQNSVMVEQNLTHEVDTARFKVFQSPNRALSPAYDDDVEIYDGSSKIFGGKIINVQTRPISGPSGFIYDVDCVDHTYDMDKILASKTYESQTIKQIIDDLISTYPSGFTSNNVSSNFTVEKIVFNQVPISTCLKRLADIVNYDWYVDEDKDVHFFPRYSNTAPFTLTDTNGNYVYKSLKRLTDGSQVINRVKVRGGEYDGSLYTDRITVSGSESKSFKLPYRFANLGVTLDPDGTPAVQNVGIDFVDDFTTDDVLYNFQEKTIRFENPLSDGDVIEFSGNPKVPVFTVSEDTESIATYGKIEKLVRDNSIESNSVARRRANAELYKYAEPVIDARFSTYTSGLRAGMLITLQSDQQGIDDELLIKKIRFYMRDHTTFMYDVELVSTQRYSFITLLQKLLEPEPRPGDESETSEEIWLDTQIITISEEYDVVNPVEDNQVVEVQENYELDPLGAGVNATYVVGPYAPSSQSDTKRPGRLDISFKAY